MGDPIWRSYHQIVQEKQDGLQASIHNGVIKPFFLYHLLIYTGLPLLALLVPRRKGSNYVRPIIFALILSIAVDVIRYRRTFLGANGYMVGLIMAWWVFWCSTLLIFTDPERDFKRIERKSTISINAHNESEPITNGNGAVVDSDAEIFNWNGTVQSTSGGTVCATEPHQARLASHSPSKQHPNQGELLAWQEYPQPFLHRVNWALGLLLNMRGPEWSWRVPTLEPLPKTLHLQLNPQQPDKYCEKTHPKFTSSKSRLDAALLSFLMSYLCLDLAKNLMMRDPYFWGVIHTPPPSFPFNYLAGYPILISLYRLHLVAFGLVVALTYACSFGPIIFLGLSLAFPNASRALTSVPLDAPWLYSDLFGPFIVPVLDNGLAGCWGQWWHQLFRFGFTSPARWFLSLLPDKLSSNRQFRRIVMTFFAFGISGTLHACGSYTQLADTKPLSGSFLYFFLQAVGIVVQNVFAKVLLPRVSPYEFPRWLRRAGNFAFSYIWLMASGPLIADDFARGGVWLTEPVPVSFIRVLGLMGNKDEGWLCWDGPWFRYWSDGSWWQSGVQVL